METRHGMMLDSKIDTTGRFGIRDDPTIRRDGAPLAGAVHDHPDLLQNPHLGALHLKGQYFHDRAWHWSVSL